MRKAILKYGVTLAASAFVLQWLEHFYAVRLYSTEIYIVLLALLFTGLGIWFGARMRPNHADEHFKRNDRAIEALKLTDREMEVLALLAEGESNRCIAGRLFISQSTIKTHLIHLYQKLEVSRRTQAVQKARLHKVIP